jgi:hypothetical protein
MLLHLSLAKMKPFCAGRSGSQSSSRTRKVQIDKNRTLSLFRGPNKKQIDFNSLWNTVECFFDYASLLIIFIEVHFYDLIESLLDTCTKFSNRFKAAVNLGEKKIDAQSDAQSIQLGRSGRYTTAL